MLIQSLFKSVHTIVTMIKFLMKHFDIKSLTDQEVISLYPKTLQELKNRKIISS